MASSAAALDDDAMDTVEQLIAYEQAGNSNPFRDNNVITLYEISKYCLMWPVALLRVIVSVIFLGTGATVCGLFG